MSTYRPYMLPLLPSPGIRSIPHLKSPVDEESLLRSLKPGDWPGWEHLPSLIRQAYGLTFVMEDSTEARVLDTGMEEYPDGDDSPPLRFLRLKDLRHSYFVLEHPDGLEQFDRMAGPDDRVVLAMPSVFTQWWLQGDASHQLSARPVTAGSKNEQQAIISKLRRLVQDCPTDWHLEAREGGYFSRLRIDGRLNRDESISLEKGRWFINSLTGMCALSDGTPHQPREGSAKFDDHHGESISIRISLVPTLYGESLTVRFLYSNGTGALGLNELGFPEDQILLLQKAYRLKEGMWILAGPTGAGKTTTLHCLVQWSVENREKVLAAEDPVERILEGVQQVSIGEPPGMSFAVALKAFMRQSPDSILIGEIRDEETAALSIQAARTGHRVLCSIHASDPSGISRRFQDLGQGPADLDPVLRVAVLQRLVPLLCPDCRKFIPLPDAMNHALQPVLKTLPRSIANPVGCPACRSGYKGRSALTWSALWPVTTKVAAPFLASAESLFYEGKIDTNSLQAFLPEAIRERFALCQQ